MFLLREARRRWHKHFLCGPETQGPGIQQVQGAGLGEGGGCDNPHFEENHLAGHCVGISL